MFYDRMRAQAGSPELKNYIDTHKTQYLALLAQNRVRPSPAIVGREQRDPEHEHHVDRVQHQVGDVIAERDAAPDHRVDGVRNIHERACDVAHDDEFEIPQVQDRRVFDDQTKIVIDERILQRVDVDGDREQRSAAGGDGYDEPAVARSIGVGR